MAVHFVSAALKPSVECVDSPALSMGEPPLPARFSWAADAFAVDTVIRTWRSTKNDRGDDYLARHWYEIRTADCRIAVVYFDRKELRGRPRWWLYTLDDGT
jgi:hypothetical protein